ncbi:MAG: molybdenum cofactor biosynthesis protein MoaE [Silvibacterium sp.]|jgi:molybdopterin synthase catalytic subunit
MIIDVALQSTALQHDENVPAGSGALVRFEGLVRPEEEGVLIDALIYEAYVPMAQNQMENIVKELAQTWPCLLARVRHRIGRVPVGDAAIVIEVFSKHRAEAFALASAFMDRLKQDVPIWKVDSVVKTQ